MPISGRPPSLIQRPSGCYFHPRCPYVRDEHKRIDPPLVEVTGDPGHEAACLLSTELRSRIWQGLAAGETPAELRQSGGRGRSAAAGVGSSHRVAEEEGQ